jgi:hypothetical protein
MAPATPDGDSCCGVDVSPSETPSSYLSVLGGQCLVEAIRMTAGFAIGAVVLLAIFGPWIAGQWITFNRANKPGWTSLIPVVNFYMMLKIGDNEWWWLVLLFVPVVQFYALYKVGAGVAKAFGKGGLYGFGLGYLPFIFFPLLAFGGAQYQGRSRGDTGTSGV